jgi:uncharacterized Zn-binding protein involved in type VI secretion
MTAITRFGDLCTGHPSYPSRQNIQGSPDVFVEGRAVHRQGDLWAVHCSSSDCHAGNLSAGSSTVFANGLQVGRIGDPVSCGSRVMTGCNTVFG